MTAIHRIVLIALLAAAGAGALAAQEDAPPAPDDTSPPDTAPAGQPGAPSTDFPSEADIFDSQTFEQAIQESKTEEEKSKLEYLVGGTFLFDNSVSTTASFDGYGASGSFAAKAFVRLTLPDVAGLYLGYLVRHPVYQGDGGTGSVQPLGDLFENEYTLAEYHLSFDAGKKVFFRVGNQLIAWGPTVIWTPVDFINLQRTNPLQSVDLRVGKPSIRVHVPMNRSNLFLLVDFSNTVRGGTVHDLGRETAYGLRLDFTALGYEFGLTGYAGPAVQARAGFDFSGRLLGADFYGEAAVALPTGSYDPSWAAAAGFQRAFGELKDWTLQGELFYNSAGAADASRYTDPIVQSGFLYLGRVYAFAGLTRQDLIGSVVDGTLSGFLNASDLSWLTRLTFAFDIPRFVPLSLSLSYTGGGAGKEFTWFTGDNGLSASLQVRFEF